MYKSTDAAFHINPLQSKAHIPHIAGVFNSISAFRKFLSASLETSPELRTVVRRNERSFYDCNSVNEALETATIGEERFKTEAMKVVAEINNKIPIKTKRVEYVASPFGTTVSPGDLIAGSPTPMRRRVVAPNASAPLTVVVGGTSSGGISAGDLLKRGAALAALLSRLAAVRPVAGYALVNGAVSGAKTRAQLAFVKLPTSPVNIRLCAHACAAQSFNRALGFTAMHALDHEYSARKNMSKCSASSYISWPFGNIDYASQNTGGEMRKDLSKFFKTDVLFMPNVLSIGGDFKEILESPAAWINRTISGLRA